MLILIILQSVNLTFVKFHYEANKDFIAKNLCVNRFNPNSDCEGKCFLMKKLKQEADQDAEKKAVFSSVLSLSFFFENNEVIIPFAIEIKDSNENSILRNTLHINPFSEIDLPPPKFI